MPKNCIVPFCKSRGKVPDISYFRVTRNRRVPWLTALGRNPNEEISQESVLCSRHFTPEDILPSGKLKEGAIPKLNLKPEKEQFRRPLQPVNLETRFLEQASTSTSKTETAAVETVVSLDRALDYSQDANVVASTSREGRKRKRSNSQSSGSTETLSSSSTEAKGSAVNFIIQLAVCLLGIYISFFPNRTQSLPQAAQSSSFVKSSSSADSAGLKGSSKKRRKFLRMDHSYSWSPRKMKAVIIENREVKSQVKSKVKTLKRHVMRLQNKVSSLKALLKHLTNKKLINEEAHAIIEKSFSEVPAALMKRLFTKTQHKKVSRKQFPAELRSFAMTLNFYSSKAYEYVRKTFNLALPAVSTIRSWMTNIKCLPGFSKTSFDILEAKIAHNAEKGKQTICALMLDEMSIKKQVEFVGGRTWGYVDLGTDIADNSDMDCASEALVFMIVAQNDNWKLQIGYFLLKSLGAAAKANLVKEALCKLTSAGVIIVSVTCDGPAVNFSMANQLGAQVTNLQSIKSYFQNPISDNNIYIIFDACHMIKLLRNLWGTLKKIVDGDGNIIDFNLVILLVEIQKKEGLRFANKLRRAHIEWDKQKMKVNLAMQTLSNSVADALEFLQKDIRHEAFINAGPTINFLRKINNIIDLLNSKSPFGRGCHTPLNSTNEVQYWRPILEDGIEYLQNLKTIDGRFLHETPNKTAIKGFIVTIKSVMGLYDEYVKRRTVLKYVLTYKLSQDHLELFFCSVRARNGWNNNPTCYQFYHTYKRLLMAHNLRDLRGNCTLQDATEILSVTSAKKIRVTAVDMNIIRRYTLDAADLLIEDHEYAIPTMKPLSLLTQNVVAYISGFCIKMVKRHIHCLTCVEALEDTHLRTMDDSLLLLRRKDRGGLLKPSSSLIEVLFTTETYIKKLLLITEDKLPPDVDFLNSFSHLLAMKLFQDRSIFSILHNDHIYDCAISEDNHVMLLIKTCIYCYTKIRLYHIGRTQTEATRGELIRKKLSKLILFHNQ